MNSIFEKNMALLAKRFPEVHAEVEKFYKNCSTRSLNIISEETKTGLLNLRIETNGSSFLLHSNYNPYNEADALINSQHKEQSDTIVFLGFGAGYHIEKMIRDLPDRNKLIIEPSLDIFIYVLEHRDLTFILEANNLLIVPSNDAELIRKNLITLYSLGKISDLDFIALPSYGRVYGEFWDNVQALYTKFIRFFSVSVRTMTVFQNLWLSNFLFNLKHVKDGADLEDFAGKFQSVPAVVVSAGPSLDKNVHLLKGLRDKILIIAAGSAISALERHGIKPHVMLGIDGGPAMSDVYNNVGWDDILFAYVFNLHVASLDCYNGPRVYVRSTVEPQVEWMESYIEHRTTPVEAGVSVANICLSFVQKLGCDPIILVGQDLAFTGMKTHADGVFGKDALQKPDNDSGYIKTKDMFGNDILTSEVLLSMCYSFETHMEKFADTTYINATEGGLNIKGTKIMPLQEVIDTYCRKDLDILSRLKEIYSDSRAKNADLNSKLIDFVEMLIKNGEKIEKLSHERLELIKKILKNIERNKLDVIPKQREKLYKLTEKLEKNVLAEKILLPACVDITLVFKNDSETKAMQAEKLKDKLSILYEGLKKQYEDMETKNKVLIFAAKEALKRLNRGQQIAE